MEATAADATVAGAKVSETVPPKSLSRIKALSSGERPAFLSGLSGVFDGWEKAGEGVLRRRLSRPLARPVPAALPEALPVVLPDLAGTGGTDRTLSPGRILFFDLETTGLSGGAGTVAFLAAFGTFGKASGRKNAVSEYAVLNIDQFLLLDYSGEPDFLDAVLGLINDPVINDSRFQAPYLTTYNGKTFDSQILKTRCLMNGFLPPKLPQLDLLYPSRRMWKRVLPNCSQATVETMALGLDRTGDIPGSLAPDIWFDFLKSDGSEAASRRLLDICDHNVKDIEGMAALFTAFCEIAKRPLEASADFRCDTEHLAMIWRRQQRLLGKPPRKPPPLFQGTNASDGGIEKTSALLLEAAARDYPRSCLRLGFDLFREGRFEEGRAALARIANGNGPWRVPRSPVVTALALRSLAIDAARRLGSAEKAAAFLEKALLPDSPEGGPPASGQAGGLPRRLKEDLERRLAAQRP
ncbi:MAG: ribonuclease H-like domain-containing protein [Treponema sp.]|nr:ribonuclease H-like domain-containing protein [Treponema sp.]